MTNDHVEALRDTLEDLRAAEFAELDADLVAKILTIYSDSGTDPARKARQLQEALAAVMGEAPDASAD